MPAYNAEKYIRDAVQSVLAQSFRDWQLFIVNDASTDGTGKILAEFSGESRIKIINNTQNLGSVVSRNVAFAQIQSQYVAILDADDLAEQTRFEEQVQFLDAHPDFGLVGSWTKIIDESGRATGQIGRDTTPAEKAPIKLLFHNFLAFSSVMMRRTAMPEIPFTENSVPAEDVDLYWKMIHQWKFATLPKVLISYRSHPKGISKVYAAKKQEVMDRLIRAELNRFGIEPTAEELQIHRTNYGYAGADIEQFLSKREQWLLKLIEKNREAKIHPEKIFSEVVAEKWLESCDANARLGFKTWKIFQLSPLSQKISWLKNGKMLSKFCVKCLLSKDTI